MKSETILQRIIDRWPCAVCLLRLHQPMRAITRSIQVPKERLLWLNAHYRIGRTVEQSRDHQHNRAQVSRLSRADRNALQKQRYNSLTYEVRSARAKRYYYADRDNIVARKVKRNQERRKLDRSIIIAVHIRNTVLRMAKLGGTRQHRSSIYLGCTYEECRAYISTLLKPPMYWSNYGVVWEIDHRHPLSSFDLTNKAEALMAAHYTNLTPMVIRDNRAKGSRITAERQMELV